MPKIDEIIGSEAFAQVAKLKVEMGELVEAFVKSSKAATLLEKALLNTDGYTSTVRGIGSVGSKLSELEKVERQLAVVNEKLSISEEQLVKDLARAREELMKKTAATKDATKANSAHDDSIDGMRLKLKSLQQAYDALGAAERNASSGKGLLGNLQAVTAELNKLEQGSGRFQRNVGNYASGFNAMSNSVTQITREMPAFTNSIQTGFMGISNNIPSVIDSINQLRAKNKELAKEGKPTESILGALADATFSWNTAISIGITLMTVYGEDIIKWAMGSGKAAAMAKELEKATKDLNEARIEGVKSAGSEVRSLELLYNAATNVNGSIEERKLAVDKLQDQYPSYFKNLDQEIILTGKAQGQYLLLKDAIVASARARAIKGKLEERASGRLSEEEEILQKIETARNLLANPDMPLKIGYDAKNHKDINATPGARNRFLNEVLQQWEKKLADKRAEYASIDKVLTDDLVKWEEQSKKVEEDRGRALLSGLGNTADKENEKARKKELQETKKHLRDKEKAFHEHIEKLKEESKSLKELKIISDPLGLGNSQDPSNVIATPLRLEVPEASITEDVKKTYEMFARIMATYAPNAKTTVKIKWTVEDKLDVFIDKYKATIDKVNELSQLTEKSIGDITSMLAARTERIADKQIKNIDRVEKAELDSISRRTMTDKQRAEETKKIELEAEARRVKIEHDKISRLRKYAAIQKAADLLSITTGTAQAVVAALGMKPYSPLNIATAIATGIAGAAQFARAAAAPLPQYKDGTGTGYHKGGGAVVGDGYEYEVIEEPNKAPYLSPNKPTIMNLAAGTKVTPLSKIEANMHNIAMRYMAQSIKPINGDTMQNAYLKVTEELLEEVKGLKEVMAKKDTNISFYGDIGHIQRVNKMFKQ